MKKIRMLYSETSTSINMKQKNSIPYCSIFFSLRHRPSSLFQNSYIFQQSFHFILIQSHKTCFLFFFDLIELITNNNTNFVLFSLQNTTIELHTPFYAHCIFFVCVCVGCGHQKIGCKNDSKN